MRSCGWWLSKIAFGRHWLTVSYHSFKMPGPVVFFTGSQIIVRCLENKLIVRWTCRYLTKRLTLTITVIPESLSASPKRSSNGERVNSFAKTCDGFSSSSFLAASNSSFAASCSRISSVFSSFCRDKAASQFVLVLWRCLSLSIHLRTQSNVIWMLKIQFYHSPEADCSYWYSKDALRSNWGSATTNTFSMRS